MLPICCNCWLPICCICWLPICCNCWLPICCNCWLAICCNCWLLVCRIYKCESSHNTSTEHCSLVVRISVEIGSFALLHANREKGFHLSLFQESAKCCKWDRAFCMKTSRFYRGWKSHHRQMTCQCSLPLRHLWMLSAWMTRHPITSWQAQLWAQLSAQMIVQLAWHRAQDARCQTLGNGP